MKLYLPHREVNLDASLSFDERNKVIYKLLEEEIEFHEEIMTVEEYFRYTWNKQPSKISMDIIGYYLTKNNAEGEDRDVLSVKKEKEIRKGSKRHTTFSGMGQDNQVKVGLIDLED
jgi:hypothetical protein